jgi:hypothetical protein
VTSKLVALVLLLMVFAIFEYLFSPRSIARPQAEELAARLLPPAVGSFRSTMRWRNTVSLHTLEIGASYRDGGGVEAMLDILLGAEVPHNGIGCWYVRGYPILWQRLRITRVANASAIFDMALFRDNQGIALLANTECYPTGCRENLFSEGFSLQTPTFSKTTAMPTPISILVRELDDPAGESEQTQAERLVLQTTLKN